MDMEKLCPLVVHSKAIKMFPNFSYECEKLSSLLTWSENSWPRRASSCCWGSCVFETSFRGIFWTGIPIISRTSSKFLCFLGLSLYSFLVITHLYFTPGLKETFVSSFSIRCSCTNLHRLSKNLYFHTFESLNKETSRHFSYGK